MRVLCLNTRRIALAAMAVVATAVVAAPSAADATEPASTVTLQRLVDGDVSFRFVGNGNYMAGGTSADIVYLEIRNVDGPLKVSCNLERGIDKEMRAVEFFHAGGQTSKETGLSMTITKEEFSFILQPDQNGDYTYEFRSLSDKPSWDWIAPHDCHVENV